MRRWLPILLLPLCLTGMEKQLSAAPKSASGISPATVSSASPQPPGPVIPLKEPQKLGCAVPDGHGAVWAFNRDAPDHICRFDGTSWSDQTAPFPSGMVTASLDLAARLDGSITALWRLKDGRVAASRHTPTGDTALGSPTGELPLNELVLAPPLTDSKNRLWVTGRFPAILRLDGKGEWKIIHRITPEEMVNPGKLPSECSMIHALESGTGIIWVLSEQQWVRRANLQGVFLISEDKVELRREFLDSKGRQIDARNILAVSLADQGHLWVSVKFDGIYKVDAATLIFERVADPQGVEPLRIVQELHQAGGDLYAVAWVTDHSVLWRLRDGVWKQVLGNMGDQQPWSSHWVTVPQGNVRYSYRLSPWFIPTEGEPVSLTWNYGFPFTGCQCLTYFPNGTLLAIAQFGEVFCKPVAFPPQAQGSSRIVEVHSRGVSPWVMDSKGSFWSILDDSPDKLSRWDGKQWKTVAIPADANGSSSHRSILPDTQGRLWILPGGNPGSSDPLPLRIYHMDSQQWRSFPSFEEALQVINPRPEFLANGLNLFGPAYSNDQKRIAFRPDGRRFQYNGVWRSESFRNIRYFDGSGWRDIYVADILGWDDQSAKCGPPWFGKDDALSVTIRSNGSPLMTWRMDSNGKWIQRPFESHYPKDPWSEQSNPFPGGFLHPPEGCVTDRAESIVMDNLGTYWLTWQGGLYKALPGKYVRVLNSQEFPVLATRFWLREVSVDPRGSAFIRGDGRTRMAFILNPKSLPPQTRIQITQHRPASITARFLENSGAAVSFRWQLDGHEWKNTNKTTISLKEVPIGKHVLRVVATNDNLLSDASSATAAFEIHGDPGQQVARLLKQLSDPDYDRRKEAIEALALQPVRSKAALIKARHSANDDNKWWIDAALQRIGISK